jgi:hypothetical protein
MFFRFFLPFFFVLFRAIVPRDQKFTRKRELKSHRVVQWSAPYIGTRDRAFALQFLVFPFFVLLLWCATVSHAAATCHDTTSTTDSPTLGYGPFAHLNFY